LKTFGTVRLKGDKWVIDCEPHVLIRMKRLFGKLGKHSHGTIRMSATDENSADLRWFLERYPMDVEPRDALESRAKAYRDRMSLVDAMLSRQVAPPPFDLAVPLREYQRIAAGVTLQTGSLLLADEVGLGKTASAIGVLSDPRTLPALVVTLTHLPRQWEAEIRRFAPRLRTHVLKQATPYDLTSLGGRGKQLGLPATFPDVIITSYSKLSGWADTLAPLVKSVIWDEAQELRREGDPKGPSRKYSAAKHIADHTSFRMGLSATPFYNYGDELRSVMNCIRPDALGTKSEFLQEWCVGFGNNKHKIKDPAAFGMYLREGALMLRRTRSEVGREIPPVTKIPHHIEADSSAIEKAEDAAAELARIILAQGGRGFDKMQAAQDLDYRMRQATGVAKAPFVAEFVRLLVESGEKVVLYGWHREFYSILCDRLKDLNPALYTGTESATQKEEAKRRFVSGETPVLIMSLRSGAGLDGLQAVCRTVVIGELDWSPGVLEQCIGRVARDGQADPVVVYYLLADTGSDPIISDVLQLKRQQIEGVRDPDAELVEQLDTGEDRMRRLAEGLLRQRGLPVPAAKEGEVAA
jgi:SNF2 family DNA or RNA helicase